MITYNGELDFSQNYQYNSTTHLNVSLSSHESN
jgi:hypothetical protein